MRRTVDVRIALTWFVALLLLIPGIKTHWTFLSFGATLNPAALSAPAFSYALFGIGVLLAFVWWCRRRRLVFGAFLLVLCALHIFLKDLTLYRIITFATYAVVIGILVEFVRQNMPLYRHLKASSARIIPMLRKSLLLWSPALLFIGFGVFLNHLIVERTTKALYRTPLIEEYCQISAKPGWPPIPCSEYRLDAPLGADDKIAIYVDGLVSSQLEEALDDLSRREAKGEEPDLEALKTKLDPIAVFGLEEFGIAFLEQRLGEIETMIDKLDKPRPKTGVSDSEWREKTEQLAELRIQKEDVEDGLRLHQKSSESHPADSSEHSFAQALRGILFLKSAMTFGKSFEALSTKLGNEEESERSATLRVSLKRIMSEEREGAKEILLAGTQKDDEGLIQFLDCPWLADGHTPVLQPVSIAESVQNSLDHWLEIREWELQEELDQLQKVIEEATHVRAINDIKTHHVDIWDRDKPFLPKLLDLPDNKCRFPYVDCWLLNSLKKKARDSYAHTRKALRDSAVDHVNETVDAMGKLRPSTDVLIKDVRRRLRKDLEDAKGYVEASVSNVVKGGAMASALLKLFLALAIIKSLFYVLATEVFHKQGVSSIGLEGETTVEGAYHLSTSVEIPREETTPLITATVGVNQGKETIIPQPASGLVSRILRNKWFLNRGTHSGTASMKFTQPGGRMGVDWELQEGEEVVFNYRDLLGFSENVELRSTISLQLSSLLFGKHLFHSARCVGGPGRLLLSVSGQIEDHQEDVQSFPLERLIAWNRHTKFKVMDERTLGAVFKDGFTVGREGDGGAGSGLVLVGAPTKRPPLVDGTIRFVKTFLMPI